MKTMYEENKCENGWGKKILDAPCDCEYHKEVMPYKWVRTTEKVMVFLPNENKVRQGWLAIKEYKTQTSNDGQHVIYQNN